MVFQVPTALAAFAMAGVTMMPCVATPPATFAAAADSCKATWTTTVSPAVQGGRLSAVAALSTGEAWAVGEVGPWKGGDDDPADPTPLIERWDGTAWTRVPVDGDYGSLDAVAVVSPTDAWAVGETPGAASSNFPAAYDHYGNGALIEHWDGQRWTRVPAPFAGPLKAVAAIGRNDVWALGGVILDGYGHQRGFIVHWNGRTWQRAVTVRARLGGLLVVSRRDMWAVGNDIALHWNGKTWKKTAVPRRVGESIGPPFLAAVAARGSTDVWAAGIALLQPDAGSTYGGQSVLLHWNGKRWLDRSPSLLASRAALSSLVVQRSGDIWLAGVDEDAWILGPGGGLGIVHARVDSRAWHDAAAPLDAYQRVESLAPESNRTLWAVGYGGVGDPGPELPSGGYPAYDHTEPLIEHYGC